MGALLGEWRISCISFVVALVVACMCGRAVEAATGNWSLGLFVTFLVWLIGQVCLIAILSRRYMGDD
jgi:hypothetical protein